MLTAIWLTFFIYAGFYTGMFSVKRNNNNEQKRTKCVKTARAAI